MSWHPVRDVRTRSAAAPSPLTYPADSDSFFVEELPLYEACGEGEHLYLEIEKRDLGTPELVARLARCLDLPVGEIGWAGLKDRRSTSRQRISLPRRAEDRLDELDAEGFRVLWACAHRNKLRMGHLAGNRFRLLLRGDAAHGAPEIQLRRLAAEGLPNYFGPQRFGRDADNHVRGRELLRSGRRIRGRRERFLLSAYQAALFNRVLVERLDRLAELLPGDLAWIHASGALFQVEDAEAERDRVEGMEISPSGPLPGRRMSEPAGTPGEWERSLLAAAGWEPSWASLLTGGRRPLRVPVGELSWRWLDDTLELGFVLPPGSYASVLLAELGVTPPPRDR